MKAVLIVLIIIGITIGAVSYIGLPGKKPDNVGDSKVESLAPCDLDKENCISSYETSPYHSMGPWQPENPRKALLKLANYLFKQDHVKVISASETYIYAQFESRIFKFIDDVEFLLSDDQDVIHFRSASRLGRKDMGVNRNRLESLKKVILSSKINK